MRKLFLVVGLSVAAGFGTGCNKLECGEGTLEENGACVAADPDPGHECGGGFHWDEVSGQCTRDLGDGGAEGICGENTTLVYDDAGVAYCVGTGGGTDCNSAPACPASSAGKMSICGRIFNVEDTQPADDGDPANGLISDSIEALLYEPINFATSPPGTATPLLQRPTIDRCGYYSVQDVTVQGSSYIAVAIDDKEGSSADDFLLTGTAMPAASAGIYHLNVWMTRRSTIALWDASDSPPRSGDTSFGKVGVFLPIFTDINQPDFPADTKALKGPPMAGLTITRTSMTVPADDYYFSDTDPLIRRTVAPAQDVTGMNGSGLMINSPLTMHGVTNLPANCTHAAALAASIPEVVFTSEREIVCN